MDRETCWHPVLPGDLSRLALGVAEEIAADLSARPPLPRLRPADRLSLAAGLAGEALFFAYLERALPDKGFGERAVELLERTLGELPEVPADQSLYSGFPGVAWVLEHLRAELVEGGEDPGEETAALVEDFLAVPATWGFDLISGLVGIGVYACERVPLPGAEACLRHVVTHLERLAERRDGAAAWKTPSAWVPPDRTRLFPDGYYLTGVAHGAAGVVSFLAAAHAAGVAARPLLDEAVSWLLSVRLPPKSNAAFSYEVAASGASPPRPARLAWCHGDPGIAAALLAAARRAGEPEWEREALALARSAAARSQGEKTVVDAGLCHGSAGLAHLFNRLYQATGDPVLADAARFWLVRTLDQRRPGQGVAGFLAWENDENRQPGWRAETGFLTGAAGVGLALLAAATAVEPAWDRVLLTSIPLCREGTCP